MRERSGTNESEYRSINFSGFLWLLICGLIAALIAGSLLLVLVLITPQEETRPAVSATPARMVMNQWQGDLLMVQCAGFQPGDNIIVFITPSMAEINSTREGITEFQAGPQGNCPSGGVRVDAETASHQGWQLVALGSRAGDLASTPFVAMPEAVVSQPRQAIAAQVQPAQETPAQAPTPQPTPGPVFPDNLWQVNYYSDRDQVSLPVPSQANNINFDSRNGWPGEYGIPTNNFRAVFSGTFDFPETRSYLFTLRLRGSARVFIDERQVIDEYRIGRKQNGPYHIPVSAGMHSIRIEYYNDYGPASIFFSWTPDSNRHDYWLGRYYNNLAMDGTPAMIRQDGELTFVWEASPGGDVGVDNFSVQWVRMLNVPRNGCVCRMFADDKVRVYVDGKLVPELSNWDAPNAWDKPVRINGGQRFVEVHFVEQGGTAQIQFTCNPVTPAY